VKEEFLINFGSVVAHIGYLALKGLNVEAQGETLGNGKKKNMNPEGV